MCRSAVSDTGHGMGKEVLSHLFEPFFTTKEQEKGTGLGLSTVYGIVKQSGGHITCYSELGKGTTFTIYFPRTVETRNETAAPVAGIATFRGSETILLVEDEEIVRRYTQTVLENNGYTVIAASGGSEALATIELQKCGVDPHCDRRRDAPDERDRACAQAVGRMPSLEGALFVRVCGKRSRTARGIGPGH